jgi:hypothetical protein
LISRLPAILLEVALAASIACRSRAEPPPDGEKPGMAQPRPAPAANAPAPASRPAIGASAAVRGRDITVPPPDVDVHVINGRNILSAPMDAAAGPSQGSTGRVRVTFWTTPEGQPLPEPQQFEGALVDLDLGLGDLPMLSPGQKRRIWIPGPTGMATLDIELSP